MVRKAFDMLVEVLVDAIDEYGHGCADCAQARNQMAVGVGTAALQLARREIEEADKVIDDAVKVLVGKQPVEGGTDLEVARGARVLERRQRNRRQPQLRPRKRRHREKGQQLAAEDLVADRFVEEGAGRQADRSSLALVEDALRLEQKRLAESLGADDDELVVAARIQEGVDLGRAMKE